MEKEAYGLRCYVEGASRKMGGRRGEMEKGEKDVR